MGGLVTYSGSQSLASGALSLVTNAAATGRTANFPMAVAERRKLDHVTLHADVAITQTVTLTLNSAKGAAYDIVLDTGSLVSEQDYQYVPLSPIYLGPGDNFTLACTNTGSPAATVSAAIVCEE